MSYSNDAVHVARWWGSAEEVVASGCFVFHYIYKSSNFSLYKLVLSRSSNLADQYQSALYKWGIFSNKTLKRY